MKKCKIAIIATALLSVVFGCIMVGLMDDIVPIHFGVDGTPDQYGSKYFWLLLPGITAVLAAVILFVERFSKQDARNVKLGLITVAVLNAMLLVVNVGITLQIVRFGDGTEGFDAGKIIMPFMGALIVVLGNIAPKSVRNSMFGFRSPWSRYNDVTWQKSQRFSGFAMVIAGVLTLVAGLIFEGITNFIILMSLLMLVLVASLLASYRYYKNEVKKGA